MSFYLLMILGLAVLVLANLKGAHFGGSARYVRGRFLTRNEKDFLAVLDETLGSNYRVFVQVRLAELVELQCGVATKRQAALNKVFGKSVDYVICSAISLEPVAVIEVDDRSHLLPGRKAGDEFVNRVFAEIGLPLVRVPAQKVYSVLGVRSALASAGIEGRLLPYQVR